MWQPVQIIAGLAVIAGGIIVFRGLRRSAPRSGWLAWLLRLLRRLAAVVIVLIGLGVTLEGTPYMTANICLEIVEPYEWCFGGDGTDEGTVEDHIEDAVEDDDQGADAADQR